MKPGLSSGNRLPAMTRRTPRTASYHTPRRAAKRGPAKRRIWAADCSRRPAVRRPRQRLSVQLRGDRSAADAALSPQSGVLFACARRRCRRGVHAQLAQRLIIRLRQGSGDAARTRNFFRHVGRDARRRRGVQEVYDPRRSTAARRSGQARIAGGNPYAAATRHLSCCRIGHGTTCCDLAPDRTQASR